MTFWSYVNGPEVQPEGPTHPQRLLNVINSHVITAKEGYYSIGTESEWYSGTVDKQPDPVLCKPNHGCYKKPRTAENYFSSTWTCKARKRKVCWLEWIGCAIEYESFIFQAARDVTATSLPRNIRSEQARRLLAMLQDDALQCSKTAHAGYPCGSNPNRPSQRTKRTLQYSNALTHQNHKGCKYSLAPSQGCLQRGVEFWGKRQH